MSHKIEKPKYKNFIISILISVIILLTAVIFTGINIETIQIKLLFPLGRLMLFITIGLIAGQLIEASGWTKYLVFFAKPFFKFAKLGSYCSLTFTTAFFSGAAANAMLLDFYNDKKISKKQLYLSNFVNQLPAYFLHLPTTFFIVLPLTGKAGLIYFILTFLSTLLRTICILIYGHFKLPLIITKSNESINQNKGAKKNLQIKKNIINKILKKLPARIINIAIFVFPIYVLVFTLNSFGLFNKANNYISQFIVTSFMPVESLSVIILSFAAEFTSGFAAAGALMEAGVLSIKQTVIALVIGNIVAFPLRALRHQLPRYMGIFSPKMGLQILLLGQSFRIVSLILVTTFFYFLY